MPCAAVLAVPFRAGRIENLEVALGQVPGGHLDGDRPLTEVFAAVNQDSLGHDPVADLQPAFAGLGLQHGIDPAVELHGDAVAIQFAQIGPAAPWRPYRRAAG